MHYEMQIYDPETKTWGSICPTGGKPYQYPTRHEAREMIETCYPDLPATHKRVAPIIDDAEAIRALLVNYEHDTLETLPPGVLEKTVNACLIDLGDWLRDNIDHVEGG